MRFGLVVLPSADWPTLVDRARTAERLRFDSLVTGDHLRHPTDPGFPFLDGWTVLAGWAAATSTIRLSMLVSNAVYRTPALLAKQAIAVDHISDGRLDLGIGAGVFETDHAMAGVPMWSAAERVARTEELTVAVDRLLRGEVGDHLGRYYRVEQAAVAPGPVQRPRPPIVVGANGPAMLRVAARHADVWNTWGGYGLDAEAFYELTAARAVAFDRACAEVGRDPVAVRRSVLVHHGAFDVWQSARALSEVVERFGAMGFDELLFYWPTPEREAAFFELAPSLPG